MPYITREDGEHFVIPSYRDVLTAKQKNALKKDILMLSQSYGEYITLQRKNATQYEVAFSPDTGYLLGESIWHQFKRPPDMIYCEAIPNTTEAILVIVKSGSVYLDGSFPLDSIPEELIIFLTQQNNFDIYIYGDVPISQTPQEGKFNFDANSVKSFTVLDKPIFPTLPLLKIYQLQLVDQVLKAHGIGVFPTKKILTALVALGVLWMMWSYLTAEKPIEPEKAPEVNPYQTFIISLASHSPEQEVNKLLEGMQLLFSIPGWQVTKVEYAKGSVTSTVESTGGKVQDLITWASNNHASVSIQSNGIFVSMSFSLPTRPYPQKIYPVKQVLATFVDKLSTVYPGNHLKLAAFDNKGVYTDVAISIDIENVSPVVLSLIGQQFKDLPFVLQSISLDVDKGSFTGSINIDALGS